MLSRTVEYALRAAVWLAARTDTPQTTQQIAAATQVPVGYLAKVLQTLGDSGLVRSQRGLGGGFVLTRDPAKITILHVVSAVEPIQRIRSCPLSLSAHARKLCALHKRLDDALASIEDAFASCTLTDLLEQGPVRAPLCAEKQGPRRPTAGNLSRGRRPR